MDLDWISKNPIHHYPLNDTRVSVL